MACDRRVRQRMRGRVGATGSLLVLLASSCGKEDASNAPTAPKTAAAPAATTSAPTATTTKDPGERATEPEPPRLRDFELADPREAEIAAVVHGDAELGLFCRGPGPLELVIAIEGAAPETRSLAAAADAKTPAVAQLPGSGARAVQVRVKAPAGTSLERARLKDSTPRLPAARTLAGALKGRSLIVVSCDALTAARLHCYGNERETSPSVDRLAREGVRFANARSQTAWTIPSVATLLTGLEQERHGVREIGEVIDPSAPTLGEAFQAAGYATAAFVQNQLLVAEAGYPRGFDSYEAFTHEMPLQMAPAVKKWLAEPRTKPFFLYVHYFPPHAPYWPPQEFATKFGTADGAVDGTERCIELLNRSVIKPGDPKVQKLAALYDNHVAFGDHLVGEIAKLAETQGREKVAVLFLADHGEGFGEHGHVGHIVNVHHEMVHVPLVLWAPGSPLAAGKVIDEPVWTPDLLPSLAELFGLPIADGGRELPGSSFAGLLEGAGPPTPRLLRLSARYSRGAPHQRGIQFGAWKLVAPYERRASALFDCASDPGETRDVSAEHPIVFAALRSELARWVAEGLTASGAPGFTPDEELKAALQKLGYVDGK